MNSQLLYLLAISVTSFGIGVPAVTADDDLKFNKSFQLAPQAVDLATARIQRQFGNLIKDEKQLRRMVNATVYVLIPDDFKKEYKKRFGEEADNVAAFVLRTDSGIIVVMHRNSPQGTLFHELTHAASNVHFKDHLGKYLNEAVTEYFTQMLLDGIDRSEVQYNANGSTQLVGELIKELDGGALDLLQAAYFGSSLLPIENFKSFLRDRNGPKALEELQSELATLFERNRIPGTFIGKEAQGSQKWEFQITGGPKKVGWSSKDTKKNTTNRSNLNGSLTRTGKSRFGAFEVAGEFDIPDREKKGWAKAYVMKDKKGDWIVNDLWLFYNGKPDKPTSKYRRFGLTRK